MITTILLGTSEATLKAMAEETYVQALRRPGDQPWRIQTYSAAMTLLPTEDRAAFAQQLVAAGAAADEVSQALNPWQPPPAQEIKSRSVWPWLLLAGGLLGGVVVLGGVYNNWAYGDWTCMFKRCVQVRGKRR